MMMIGYIINGLEHQLLKIKIIHSIELSQMNKIVKYKLEDVIDKLD